jgi:hypothetical protein
LVFILGPLLIFPLPVAVAVFLGSCLVEITLLELALGLLETVKGFFYCKDILLLRLFCSAAFLDFEGVRLLGVVEPDK